MEKIPKTKIYNGRKVVTKKQYQNLDHKVTEQDWRIEKLKAQMKSEKRKLRSLKKKLSGTIYLE